MSIKSQKSLNEEISEIWERSYSVRSLSEESLNSTDPPDADSLSRQLLHALTPPALSKLRRAFRVQQIRTLKDVTKRVEQVMLAAAASEGVQFASPRRDVTDRARWIDETGFVLAVEEIFGGPKYTPHARQLYRTLDPFLTGAASWAALVEKLVECGARKTRSRVERWSKVEDVRVTQLTVANRETLVKLVNIATDSSWCVAAVTRGGRVGVYWEERLLHQYERWHHPSGASKRVKNSWVTDAIYLSDVQYLLISASDRSLAFYDASILAHAPVYCITGLPNIPTCLAYAPSLSPSGQSELAIGDERGLVTRAQFLQPRVALFYKTHADKNNCYFWMELSSPPHTAYVSLPPATRAHTRAPRRLQYCGERLVSCSLDGACSVRVSHRVHGFTFSVPRGITCFHVSPSLRLLAGGSADGTVRLWGLAPAPPHASLRTRAPVLDVRVVEASQVVVAVCKNCEMHIWDIYEECLLQVIKLKFPFLGVLGKKVEFGNYCIHPGPPRMKEPAASPPPPGRGSRRFSVYHAETGGLLLQEEETHGDSDQSDAYNTSELIVSCCDYICRVTLGGGGVRRGVVPPPPGDTKPARRPREWTVDDCGGWLGPMLTASPVRKPAKPVTLPRPAPDFLTPETARVASKESSLDLDQLLENAGLQGILEKDFVLMMGLKHDLNQKLDKLSTNMHQIAGPVSLGAPYLALTLHQPAAVEPVDERQEQYRDIMRLFPSSVSTASSPRSRSGSRADSRRTKSTGSGLQRSSCSK